MSIEQALGLGRYRTNGSKSLKLVICLLATLVLVFASVSAILSFKLYSLNLAYTELQEQYKMLNESYSSLWKDYRSLNQSYTWLEQEYQMLQTEYDVLEAQYNQLSADHEAFTSAYSSLVSLVNRRSRPQGSEWKQFVTPRDPSVVSKMYEITGGWETPGDWSEIWSDIDKMYTWVVNNIEYSKDQPAPVLPDDPTTSSIVYVNELVQFPNETLERKEGDCEDMAILLASLIRAYVLEAGYDLPAEVVTITNYISGHAAAYLPVEGGKICILDPAGRYSTRDWLGCLCGKDVREEVYNWLNYWAQAGLPNAIIYFVFSDSMYKFFGDTEAFIDWMYERTAS